MCALAGVLESSPPPAHTSCTSTSAQQHLSLAPCPDSRRGARAAGRNGKQRSGCPGHHPGPPASGAWRGSLVLVPWTKAVCATRDGATPPDWWWGGNAAWPLCCTCARSKLIDDEGGLRGGRPPSRACVASPPRGRCPCAHHQCGQFLTQSLCCCSLQTSTALAPDRPGEPAVFSGGVGLWEGGMSNQPQLYRETPSHRSARRRGRQRRAGLGHAGLLLRAPPPPTHILLSLLSLSVHPVTHWSLCPRALRPPHPTPLPPPEPRCPPPSPARPRGAVPPGAPVLVPRPPLRTLSRLPGPRSPPLPLLLCPALPPGLTAAWGCGAARRSSSSGSPGVCAAPAQWRR